MFQSRTALEKQADKLSAKQEELNIKSTGWSQNINPNKTEDIDMFDTYRILSRWLPWSVSQSVTHKIFYQNKSESILVSLVCGNVEIKYSNQILQSCS